MYYSLVGLKEPFFLFPKRKNPIFLMFDFRKDLNGTLNEPFSLCEAETFLHFQDSRHLSKEFSFGKPIRKWICEEKKNILGLNLLFVYTLNFYFPSLISKGGMREKRRGIGPVFLGLLLRGYLTTLQKAKLARDSCWFKRGHVREEKKYTECSACLSILERDLRRLFF